MKINYQRLNLTIFIFLIITITIACNLNSEEKTFSGKHLFSLDTKQSNIYFENRPTPTIAVNNKNIIAFPSREYTIGLFRLDGTLITQIIDSTNIYPREMMYDELDNLIVLSYDYTKIIKYSKDVRVELPLLSIEDWWRHSNSQIASYLEDNTIKTHERKQKCQICKFPNFDYYCDIRLKENKMFINGDIFEIYDIGSDSIYQIDEYVGYLIGIVGENYLVIEDESGWGYLYNYINKKEEVEIDLDKIIINDTLPRNDTIKNGPLYNKFNNGHYWYWQASSNKIYSVHHTRNGFIFYQLSF